MAKRKTLGDQITELQSLLHQAHEKIRERATTIAELGQVGEDFSVEELCNLRRGIEKMADRLGVDADVDDVVREVEKIADVVDTSFPTVLAAVEEAVADQALLEETIKERDDFDNRAAGLESALAVAAEDREALLRRLGLTDFEWSMQGGRSYTDLEV